MHILCNTLPEGKGREGMKDDMTVHGCSSMNEGSRRMDAGTGKSESHENGNENVRSHGANVLVIGIGNEYRRDDGVGIAVAKRVMHIVGDTDGVDIVEVSDASDLLNVIHGGYRRVIVIDAVCPVSDSIGTVHRLHGEEMLSLYRYLKPQPSTHTIDIVEALNLGTALGMVDIQDIVFFGIEGRDFGFGAGLSPELERCIDSIAEEIIKEIGRGDMLVA